MAGERLDSWVIIFVRKDRDYPAMTSNIANGDIARQMARDMVASGDVADVLAVCEAEALRRVPGSVFPATGK